MKAISIRQPWASLIVLGQKTIEIRTWPTDYRGRLFIHAAKTVDGSVAQDFPGIPRRPLGAIVAEATLESVVEYYYLQEFQADYQRHWNSADRFESPSYGFVLANVEQIYPSIPYKGQLGLFEVKLEERV